VAIYDLTGALISAKEITKDIEYFNLNLHLAKGIYLVKI
jgi:hypothetical protein